MKNLLISGLLIIMLMPSAFSAQIPKIRYADEGSDQVSKIRFTIPDYCKEFTNDNDIYFSLVREYKDCIIIQKSLKKGDDQNQYFSFDVDFLTARPERHLVSGLINQWEAVIGSIMYIL